MRYRLLHRLIMSGVLLTMLLGSWPGAANATGPEDELIRRLRTPQYLFAGQEIRVPGAVMNDTPGAPRLPVYGTLVELPPTGDWELVSRTTGSRTLPERPLIPAAPVADLVLAGPESWTQRQDLPGIVPTTDRPDPAIYKRNAFYPASPAVAGDVQWQRGRRLLAVRIFPFQYNPVTREVRYHPDIEIAVRVTPHQGNSLGRPATGPDEATEVAALNSGALRIRTGERGLYRLTYDDLLAAGTPLTTVNPRSFFMTYRGEPVQIQVTGEADGAFDPGDLVIFYAEPYQGRYMTENVHRFFWKPQAASPLTRMPTRTVAPTGAEPVATAITQTVHIEFDRAYYSNYALPQDADHWFDNPIYPYSASPVVTRTYALALDDPLAAGNVHLRARLYGGQEQATSPDQSVAVWLNNHRADTWQWDGRTGFVGTASAPAMVLDPASNTVKLEAALSQLPGIGEYWVYPDWIEVSYPARAEAELDRIFIEGIDIPDPTAQITVTGFTTETVRVYDVRRPSQPVQLLAMESISDSIGYALHFWDAWNASAPAPRYALSTSDALLAPTAVEFDAPSLWRTNTVRADYIAIVHRSLWDAIDPLLERRRAEGLAVAKVDVQDIYDEFNQSRVDPEAIRDFLTYAYHNWNQGGEPPRYVGLVGNGHYDFKFASGTTAPNLIPPYLIYIDPWIGETAADNRYVSVDGADDYLPDMAIGRIPARTPAALTEYIQKIVAYEDPAVTPDGDWNNRVNFVADNCMDGAGNFHTLSDDVRLNWLPEGMDDRTIYYGSTTNCPGSTSQTDTPNEMNTEIKAAFNAGTVMLQWFGHASRWRWGSVSWIYNYLHPPTLDANTRLPLTVVFSCWDGYFIDLDSDYQVLGAQHAMQPGRAAIADFSPTGLHLGSALLTLDQGLALSLFRDRSRPAGDATTQAKLYYFAVSTAWPDVIDTQILFGDPALRLRVPATPPTAPQVDITAKGTSASLSWPHALDSAQYEVWRATAPYFTPETEGVQVGAVDAGFVGRGAAFTFEDDGTVPPPAVQIIGDAATNYFWVARSRNGDGASALSNRVGEFDFALVAGTNEN